VRETLAVAVVFSPGYQVRLGGLERLHAFDITKYGKIHDALVEKGVLDATQVISPPPVSDEEVRLVHTEAFLESLDDPRRVATYLEASMIAVLPASVVKKKILRPLRLECGGTIAAARQALRSGIAVNLGGGFHHAKPDAGEGFCVFADIAIAVRVLQREKKAKRALVIDLDVHQGNGTAVCFAGDDLVYTFSMHQGSIYPIPKENGDRDVELRAGTDDKQYLAILARELPGLFERARPDIVFYQAGCDTLQGDPLAGLKMTREGIAVRDSTVIEACVKRNVPVVMMLGGGYSKDAWRAQYLSVERILKKYGQARVTEEVP
jgi:histone deacetylase 11